MVTARDLDALPFERVERELCSRPRGFRYFFPPAFRILEPHTELIEDYYLDAIALHLDAQESGEIDDLIVNIPPRFLKSNLISAAWPAYVWAFRDAARKFLTTSYVDDYAVRDALKTRRIIESKWYQNLITKPDGTQLFRLASRKDPQLAKLKDLDHWYQNDQGGQRFAVGVKGAATGEGGNDITVDDPVDPKRANSETEREFANNWWDGTMSTRGDNPKKVKRRIIMQRLHTRDLTGHVIDKYKGSYTVLRLPMRFDPKKICITHGLNGQELYRDPRTKDGELLSKRFDDAAVKKLELALGESGTAAQLQQDPIPPGGLMFKTEWVRRWRILPARWDAIALSADLNMGFETEEGSYNVIEVWGFAGPDAYVLHVWRERCDINRSEEVLLQLRRQWRPNLIYVEQEASGRELIKRVRKVIPAVIAVIPQGDKSKRAEAVTGIWKSLNVWVPESNYAPWVADFVTEILSFPCTPNDQVDAMSQALSQYYLDIDEEEAERRAHIAARRAAVSRSPKRAAE